MHKNISLVASSRLTESMDEARKRVGMDTAEATEAQVTQWREELVQSYFNRGIYNTLFEWGSIEISKQVLMLKAFKHLLSLDLGHGLIKRGYGPIMPVCTRTVEAHHCYMPTGTKHSSRKEDEIHEAKSVPKYYEVKVKKKYIKKPKRYKKVGASEEWRHLEWYYYLPRPEDTDKNEYLVELPFFLVTLEAPAATSPEEASGPAATSPEQVPYKDFVVSEVQLWYDRHAGPIGIRV